MKNIFDTLKSGNFSDIGNTINSALGNVTGQNQQANTAQASNQSSALGGIGGLVGSAAVGGLLGALFTGKKAKKMAKGALTVGGTAAVGALAWTFYQKWSQSNAQNQETQANSYQTQNAPQAPQKALPPADDTALLLLEAMIYAARADGHIDEEEEKNIHNAVAALFPSQEMVHIIDGMIKKPIDPTHLASRVQNKEEAYDLYRLSCAAIDIDSFMERSYLDGLASALKLDENVKKQIEEEAAAL